jgi:hypothetical protein
MDSEQIVVGTQQKNNRTTYGWIDCDDAEERVKRWLTNPEEYMKKIKAKKKK